MKGFMRILYDTGKTSISFRILHDTGKTGISCRILHDTGKTGISCRILTKRGELIAASLLGSLQAGEKVLAKEGGSIYNNVVVTSR